MQLHKQLNLYSRSDLASLLSMPVSSVWVMIDRYKMIPPPTTSVGSKRLYYTADEVQAIVAKFKTQN